LGKNRGTKPQTSVFLTSGLQIQRSDENPLSLLARFLEFLCTASRI
jgi:hypothetical protein